jgi:hypothetical protein
MLLAVASIDARIPGTATLNGAALLRPLVHVCREPRGLGFLEFYDERDAEEAIRSMDRMMLGGREVSSRHP